MVKRKLFKIFILFIIFSSLQVGKLQSADITAEMDFIEGVLSLRDLGVDLVPIQVENKNAN